MILGGLLLALCAYGIARAQVNPEGVSGVLNTPTAEVVDDGVAVFTMGRFMRQMSGGADAIARSYSMTVGFLPRFEVTARFIDFPTIHDDPLNQATNFQDRSVSAKYLLPLSDRWTAALGALDVGGQSQINQAFYGAVTYKPSPELTLSAGAGTKRLSGAFASARWSPLSRISLISEYDTQDVNYGIEVRPLKGLALMAGMANGHSTFSGSYSFPLDPRGPASPCAPVVIKPCDDEFADPQAQACAVRDALVAESYENVLVGVAGDTLYVECESRRFTEQADALAVAAALAVEHAGPGIARVEVSPKLEDVPQLTFAAGVSDYVTFLADPAGCTAGLSVTPYEPGRFPHGTTFACEGNKKNGHGEVLVDPLNAFEITHPGRPTFMTKWGLGLSEQVYLGRALKLKAKQTWFMLSDMELEGEKTKPHNREAWLSYTDAWTPNLYVSGAAGYFGFARYGAFGEAGYYFPRGRFKLGGRYGYLRTDGDVTDKQDGIGLVEASYFAPQLDLTLTAMGGQFLKGDQGLRVEGTREFGPTELTFFAYDTNFGKTEGGFRFYVPLPWYNQRRYGAWRVAGAPLFHYQYRTDSKASGQLAPSGPDLEGARQRLRPEYVEEHLLQFRRAVQVFMQDRR